MRRMRELALQILIFAVPAALALYGIHFGIRRFYLKPDALSQLEAPSKDPQEGQVISPESIAQRERELERRSPAEESGGWFSRLKGAVGGAIGGNGATSGLALSEKNAESLAKLREDMDGQMTRDGACVSGEYRGLGKAATPGKPIDQWARTQGMFESSRASVRDWLKANKEALGGSQFEAMRAKVDSTRAVLDTRDEMPDLAWRGIGVLLKDAEGAPVVHLASGFVRMVHRDPSRARFEMVRLIAQAWSPCETSAFNDLARCLKTDPGLGCGVGGYSEAAWAISTALAVRIAPPGCDLAVFKDPGMAACLKKAGNLVVERVPGASPPTPHWVARAGGRAP